MLNPDGSLIGSIDAITDPNMLPDESSMAPSLAGSVANTIKENESGTATPDSDAGGAGSEVSVASAAMLAARSIAQVI